MRSENNEEYTGYKTNKKCKRCGEYVYKEIHEEIDYPYVCLYCDENMYEFEVEEYDKDEEKGNTMKKEKEVTHTENEVDGLVENTITQLAYLNPSLSDDEIEQGLIRYLKNKN